MAGQYYAVAFSVRRERTCPAYSGARPGSVSKCTSSTHCADQQAYKAAKSAHSVGRPSVTSMMTRGLDLSALASSARQWFSPAAVNVPSRFCLAARTCARM